MTIARTMSAGFAMALACSCGGPAATNPSAAAAPAASAAAPELGPGETLVSKAAWSAAFTNELAKAMCKAEMYFRQCFSVSEEECLESVREATTSCLAENADKIPDPLLLPRDGRTWGGPLGSCAGTAFMKANSAAWRNDDARCNDPNAWGSN